MGLLLTMYSGSMNGSFTATTVTPFFMQARSTRRPMRPNLSRDKGSGGCPNPCQQAEEGTGEKGIDNRRCALGD